MATLDKKGPGPSLVARIEERLLTPFKRDAFAARTWFLVTVAAVLALHAGAIGYFLYRDGKAPVQTAKFEETPVEVVVEPPKPPPPKAPEPPKPVAKPEIEKPAASAPRAPSEDKIETQRLDPETRAPKAPEPPTEGAVVPPEEATSPAPEPADPDTKQQAAKNDVLEKDAEALAKVLPDKPPEAKVAKTPPVAKVRRAKVVVQRLAGRSDLPDYKFAKPTKKAPITGGHEDNRYLANVFAKIMANYRPSVVTPVDAVTVAFEVDDDGSILETQIVQSSGDREADEAAVAAVARASPLPPLPKGAPHGLVARIGADAAPLVTMDGRGH